MDFIMGLSVNINCDLRSHGSLFVSSQAFKLVTRIQEIAAVLQSSMRDTDVISRYGGEEMVIILRDTPKETAVKIAERVRSAVEALRIPGSHGEELQVTISLGVSTYPTDTLIRDRLFYLVDSALYAAKEGGRNRVVPFSEDLLADSIKIQ